MSGVGAGLGVIWAIIGLGYLLGKLSVLQPAAQEPLNRLVYVVGLPAIVVQTLATADIRALIGAPLLVAACSALIAAAVTAAALARRFGRTTVLIAVMGGSLANAAYLGVPIAQYVLGDSSHVAPVILFQIGFLTPLLFTLADIFSPAATVRAGSIIKMVLGNPLLLAAVAGAALSLTGWRPPAPVWNVVEVLSGLAVPCILIAFGLSFVGERPRAFTSAAVPIAVASAAKVVLQPLVAYLIGRYALALAGADLFAVVAMAALPTAQNAYLAAYRVRAGQDVARGVVLATTVLVTPVLMVLAVALT